MGVDADACLMCASCFVFAARVGAACMSCCVCVSVWAACSGHSELGSSCNSKFKKWIREYTIPNRTSYVVLTYERLRKMSVLMIIVGKLIYVSYSYKFVKV